MHDPVPKVHSVELLDQNATIKNQYLIASDYVLDNGHVNTVEPGVYFIPYMLKLAKEDAKMNVSHLINWKKVDKWRDVGGIRIEDVVAIDWAGKSVILTDN